jgi:CHAD domain-containing protein
MVLLPKVLIEDDPDAVHDFRVWSRRLQQVVVTISPAPLPLDGHTIVRILRHARRTLSEWRDCDVLIDLLERKARRVRDRDEKRAWERIRDWALSERKRQMRRARRKLADCELLRLPQRVRKLTRACIRQIEEQEADLAAVLSSSVGRSYEQWRQALSGACNSLDPSDIHAFRIESKRLRYRIELARDLCDGGAEAVLAFLKELQDELGTWHDHTELAELAAKALANSQFMLVQPRVATAVLQKLARDNTTYNERVRQLLMNTRADVDRSLLHVLVARYSTPTPAVEAASPRSKPLKLGSTPLKSLSN